MYTSATYHFDKESQPAFSTLTNHGDGTYSVSINLNHEAGISFCGTVAQLAALRDAFNTGAERADCPGIRRDETLAEYRARISDIMGKDDDAFAPR